MKLRSITAALVAAGLVGCGQIETGNVGVVSRFGTVLQDIYLDGFYVAVITSVTEYTGKEYAIELNDLTPKAKDNLSLRDMDVTVYVKTDRSKIRDLVVKYIGQSQEAEGVWYPAYSMVYSVARNVIYDEVSNHDSLTMHTRRDEMAVAIKNRLQEELEVNDPKAFTITRVVLRAVNTDPTIEQSIQANVAKEKELEAKTKQVEIEKKNAEIEIVRAKGIAQANNIINSTLTREYLQHETNDVLRAFAEKGGTTTVIMPANMQAAPLVTLPVSK